MIGPDARGLRILSEYIEPNTRLDQHDVSDTVVFFGSVRLLPGDVAEEQLETTKKDNGDLEIPEQNLMMSQFYEDSRELAKRLTV
jgi:hypothetical protein